MPTTGARECAGFLRTTPRISNFEPHFEEVRALGDRVLGIGRFRIRARGSGVETDFPVAGIATYREGKLVRWEDFRERHLALEAAGLRE